MFGVFFHPRSVARQREVPELSVPMTAAVRVTTQALEVSVAPTRRREAIEFKVRYRFGEYLGFTIPMAIRMKARARRAKGRRSQRAGSLQRALFAAMTWPFFAYKSWRVGPCRFRIDAHGIERDSRAGRLRKSWSEIVVMRREAPGWILGTSNGGLPLPMRCMSAADQQLLERWIAARRAALHDSGRSV